MEIELIGKDYADFLRELKGRIRNAQVRAALNVNRELVLLYWQIGREIRTRQGAAGWGAKIIEQLSRDLRREFPEMKGFSLRNLKYMRAFSEAWPDEQFVQQVAAQIPWFHNCVLLDKVTDPTAREWYIRQTIQNGWSRHVLAGREHLNFRGTHVRFGNQIRQNWSENTIENGLLILISKVSTDVFDQNIVVAAVDRLRCSHPATSHHGSVRGGAKRV